MLTHIPVWRTFSDAVTFFKTHLPLFIKGMAAPLILFIACMIPQAVIPINPLSQSLQIGLMLCNLFQPLLLLWMSNICYRIAITDMPGKMWWTIAETTTLLMVIALAVLVSIGASIPAGGVYFLLTALNAPLLTTTIIAGITYGVLLLYLMARFSLIFPSIAIGERMRFEDTWKMSRGNAWRIVLLLSLPTLLTTIAIGIFTGIIAVALPPPTPFMISFILAQLGGIIVFCVNGIALALAYKQLK